MEKTLTYFGGKVTTTFKAETNNNIIYVNGMVVGCYLMFGKEYKAKMYRIGSSYESNYYVNRTYTDFSKMLEDAIMNIARFAGGDNQCKENQESISEYIKAELTDMYAQLARYQASVRKTEKKTMSEDMYALLLDDYNKVLKVISKAPSLGEIGCMLRRNGYYVLYDGFSCCTFRSKVAAYSASNYEREWKLSKRISVYDENDKEYKFDVTDKTKAPDMPSLQTLYTPKEKYELGLIKKDNWVVFDESGREIFSKQSFPTFEEAKEYAYNLAKQNCERIRNRKDDTSRNARLTELSDKYNSVLAYEYYNYQECCLWVSVG